MEYRKVSELTPLENNPRTITDGEFKKLVASIKKNKSFFEARPCILSDRTGKLVIIAGNQRYRAALSLNHTEIPTFLMSGLSEAEEREIIIRDNKSNGVFDWDILANSWDSKELEEWGVSLPMNIDDYSDEEKQGLGTPIIQYNIVFDDESQQDAWFGFIKKLKTEYPDMETIAERITAYICRD